MDGIYPVSTCRLHYLDEHTGKIERVATLESYRGKHYGQAGIIEAENWMREKGVTKIYINSRKAALGFYEKLGYTETDIPAFLGIDGTDAGFLAVEMAKCWELLTMIKRAGPGNAESCICNRNGWR